MPFDSPTRWECDDCGLTELPSSLVTHTALRHLSADGNALGDLPDALDALPLERLDVRRNRLTRVPDVVSRVRTLRDLRLGANALTDVPASLFDLDQGRSALGGGRHPSRRRKTSSCGARGVTSGPCSSQCTLISLRTPNSPGR
jgi:Leucine-rich repeat (LRR) protein